MITRFFCIILLLTIQLPSAMAMEARFKQRAEISADVIRLGDIVTFDEKTAATAALKTQMIAQAPAPGERVLLQSKDILRRLSQTQPDFPREIVWTGAGNVSVLRLGTIIDKDIIAKIINEFLFNRRQDLPEAKVRFIPSALPLPFTLPAGRLSHQVIPSNPAILGSSRIAIIFSVDDRVVKNISLRGKVEALANVVVASSRLKRGTLLQPHHLRLAKRDLGELRSFILSLNQAVGKRLTRTLRADSTVSPSMLTTPPIIRKGEVVKMYVSSGPMLLTATGVAYKDGAKDQMIRVQNLGSKKILYCRVAAPGIVEVRL